MEYIEAFNGFRGFGFLNVILDHYTYPSTVLDMGQFGVGMFYVLSSYLLTLILYKQYMEKGTLNLINYWIRRFFRIYPLLTLVLIFEYFLVKRYDFETLIGIYFLYNCEGIYWTIFIEMRFYIIIPIVVFIFAKVQNLYKKFTLMLLITIIGYAYHYYLNYIKGGFSFFRWDIEGDSWKKNIVFVNYLPVFLLGSFMAIIVYHLKKAKHNFNKYPKTKGAFILFMSLIHFVFIYHRWIVGIDDDSIPWCNYNGIFCLGYCFIFMFFNGENFMSKFFGLKAVAFFGNISYPGYLFHTAIREFMFRTFNWQKNFKDLLFCFLITIVVSYILHITVENFFINKTKMWCLKKPENNQQNENGKLENIGNSNNYNINNKNESFEKGEGNMYDKIREETFENDENTSLEKEDIEMSKRICDERNNYNSIDN
jgi:peptidoglycan/LPS O-acetylase OafA/YrhL